MDHLLKAKKEYKNLKKQEIQDIFIKACFHHYMAYGDFKDLPKRTASDKVLHDKAFNIAKDPEYENQRGVASMVYKCVDEKSLGGAVTGTQSETLAALDRSAIKSEIMIKQKVAKELHKPIVRKSVK